MYSTLRPASGRALVALATWWGVSLWCSSSAHATCGDYLVHGGAMNDLARDSGAAHTQDAPAHPTPCRGPNCRSNDRSPLAPAPTIEVVVEHWAHCLRFASPLQAGTATRIVASDVLPAGRSLEPQTPPPALRLNRRSFSLRAADASDRDTQAVRLPSAPCLAVREPDSGDCRRSGRE